MSETIRPDAADEVLTLRPTDLDQAGAGVARHEDLIVHVARALPGEDVTARLVHTSPHRRPDGSREGWGKLVEIVRPSPDRVAPACPGYGDCGGCVLQHLASEAQRDWKRRQVEAALAEVFPHGPPLPPIAPCFASPQDLGYRNQAKYVVGRDDQQRVVLGAYAPRSHQIVDLAGCLLGEPPQNAIAVWLRDGLQTQGIPPFNERTKTGNLRYVVIRTNAAGEALVTLVTARSDLPGGTTLATDLQAAFPEVVGVVQNVNGSAGNAIFGREEHVLAGSGTISESFGGVAVELGPRAFAQLNRGVATAAYAAIRAAFTAASGGRKFTRLVDLHSGVGAIAFALADLADDVVAIEVNESATSAGTIAAARAAKRHVRFINGDAAVALDEIGTADALVLNPPRAGAGSEVCAGILRLRPQVLAYLSCDPGTLARDLEHLVKPAGFFEFVSIQPFDMLPHTTHVETLVVLRGNAGPDVSGRYPSS